MDSGIYLFLNYAQPGRHYVELQKMNQNLDYHYLFLLVGVVFNWHMLHPPRRVVFGILYT